MNTRLLLEGFDILGLAADQEQVKRIELYVDELERWNRRMNLVRASGDSLIVRHIFDCLAGLPAIQALEPSALVDVGSGAGLPGILLSVFLAGTEVALLERSTKRASFLRNVIALLGAAGPSGRASQPDRTTHPGRCSVAEVELEREQRLFDVVCCRAFRPLKSSFRALVTVHRKVL